MITVQPCLNFRQSIVIFSSLLFGSNPSFSSERCQTVVIETRITTEQYLTKKKKKKDCLKLGTSLNLVHFSLQTNEGSYQLLCISLHLKMECHDIAEKFLMCFQILIR